MKLTSDRIGDYIANAAGTIFTLENEVATIERITAVIVKALKSGKMLLACGNGGSAAEATHLAEELTGKYSKPRKALPAISLCSDATAMTCIANDWGFDFVFARQVEAYAKKGDVLVVFTTSGNSENCIKAAKAMKKAGGVVVGLLGKGGGKVKKLCDLSLVVEAAQTNHIQEAHQVVLHLILEAVDGAFG